MKMESPKVFVPKEFRKNLSERFDYGNRKLMNNDYVVNIPCLLCKSYFSIVCNGCPFSKYKNKGAVGCRDFVNDALDGKRHFALEIANLWWLPKNDKAVKQELALLQENAESMIEWL